MANFGKDRKEFQPLLDLCNKLNLSSSSTKEHNSDTGFDDFGKEIVCILENSKLPLDMRVIGLTCAIHMTKASPVKGNQLIWSKLFKFNMDLMSTNECMLLDVNCFINSINIGTLMFNLNSATINKWTVFDFQLGWNVYFSVYSCIQEYLTGKILDSELEVPLKKVVDELENFLLNLLQYVHDNGHPKFSLTSYCTNMILNRNKNTSKGYNPIFIRLIDTEGLTFQRVSTNNMSNDEIASHLNNHVKFFHLLINRNRYHPQQNIHHSNQSKADSSTCLNKLSNLDNLSSPAVESGVSTLAKEIFCRLLEEYGEKYNDSEDALGHMKQKEKLLDIADGFESSIDLVSSYNDASKYVNLQLLSEFGKTEENIEDLLQRIEMDNDCFTMLMYAIRMIEKQVKLATEKNQLLAGDEVLEGFIESLVQALEMIEAMCNATYLEEKERWTKISQDRNSLTGWNQLNKILPFLDEMSSITRNTQVSKKATFELLGIPSKCEELGNFIRTKGRGVQKSSEAPAKRRDRDELQEVLFQINTKSPSNVGQGLVQLKKLIHLRNSGIDDNLDLIFGFLEKLLDDSDEYVYNHCINALVSLAIDRHQILIPKLVELYAFTKVEHNKSSEKVQDLLEAKNDDRDTFNEADGILENDLNLKHRLKLGEVLSKIFISLGPISTIYANQILNAAFALNQKTNPWEIRSSSFQVLSSIVSQLGYELDQFLPKVSHWSLQIYQEENQDLVNVSIWKFFHSILEQLIKQSQPQGIIGDECGLFLRDVFELSKHSKTNEFLQLRDVREAFRERCTAIVSVLINPTIKPFQVQNFIFN